MEQRTLLYTSEDVSIFTKDLWHQTEDNTPRNIYMLIRRPSSSEDFKIQLHFRASREVDRLSEYLWGCGGNYIHHNHNASDDVADVVRFLVDEDCLHVQNCFTRRRPGERYNYILTKSQTTIVLAGLVALSDLAGAYWRGRPHVYYDLRDDITIFCNSQLSELRKFVKKSPGTSHLIFTT